MLQTLKVTPPKAYLSYYNQLKVTHQIDIWDNSIKSSVLRLRDKI